MNMTFQRQDWRRRRRFLRGGLWRRFKTWCRSHVVEITFIICGAVSAGLMLWR